MNAYLINLLNCISYFTFFYIFFSELTYSKLKSIVTVLIESCLTYAVTFLSLSTISYDLITLVTVILFQIFLFDNLQHSKSAIIAVLILFLNLLHTLLTSVITIIFIPLLHISLRTEAVIALLQIISFYVFYVFAKYLHSRKTIINTSVLSDFFLILFIPFLMSYSIQYLYYQYRTSVLLILLILSILLDVAMIIIMTAKIHDLEIIEHEKIASAILKQSEQQFQSMLNNENRIRKIRHDIKNHFLMIQSLCSEQKYTELSVYINQLSESASADHARIYCSNVYLNTLLNSKAEQHKDIQFSILLLSLPSAVESIDLCIMIANLLDNAIKEIDTHTELSRNIILKMYAKGNFQFIVIQNPLSHNKTLRTEKSDSLNHGLGLSIVQEIVDKYNGNLLITQNDLFTVTIMFENSSHS